jgi:hypothetical protein
MIHKLSVFHQKRALFDEILTKKLKKHTIFYPKTNQKVRKQAQFYDKKNRLLPCNDGKTVMLGALLPEHANRVCTDRQTDKHTYRQVVVHNNQIITKVTRARKT